MEIIQTSDFQQTLSKLPKNIQRLFTKQEKRFLENYRDPRLHIKLENLANHSGILP